MSARALGVLAALVLAATPPALAQDGDPDDTPLRAGARALVFGIDPTAGLTGIGGTVGVKWHRSEARAVRLALTANGDVSFGDERDEQSATAGASVLFLSYARPRTQIYVYHGLGPTASVFYRRSAFDRDGQTASGSFAVASAGVAGVVGVEWPVSSAISLTGEYGAALQATYSHESREQQGGGQTFEGSNDAFGASLSSRGATAGVNVYF